MEQMTGKDLYQYLISTGDNFVVTRENAFSGIQSVLNLGILASAIDFDRFPKPSKPEGPKVISRVSICKSVYEREEMMQASAQVTGAYGQFAASLSASYMKEMATTETSTDFLIFWSNALGRVLLSRRPSITESAMESLKSNPEEFVRRYGTHYIAGYVLGAEVVAKLTINASSLEDKSKIDVAVSASYGEMLNASAEFKQSIEEKTSHYSLALVAQAVGTSENMMNISSLEDLQKALARIADDKNLESTATITQVMVASWLSLPDVAENVHEGARELFEQHLSPMELGLYCAQYERLVWMYEYRKQAYDNLDKVLHRQWFVKDKGKRLHLLESLNVELDNVMAQVSNITEKEVAKEGTILQLKEHLDNLEQHLLKPALKLVPIHFSIDIAVSSDYDDYVPNNKQHHEMTINPSLPQNQTKYLLHLDNGHSNCRHFYGDLTIEYVDSGEFPELHFDSRWTRVCGSKGNSTSFILKSSSEGGKGTLEYDNTIRVDISVSVTVEDLNL